MSAVGRAACLVGVGETRYAKWGGITGTSEYQLAVDAVLAAIADAGMTPDDIDGLASFAEDRNEATFMAADLGLPELRYASLSWLPGGGGACAAVANAAMAVQSGAAEAVVVYRSLCQGQFRRFGQGPGNIATRPGPPRIPHVRRATSLLEAHVAYTMPFGMFSPPIAYAMVLRRHMHRFGTTVEHMGHVAVTTRAHAARNPRAVMGDRPMTMDDYLASRWVSEPFRLFDCCLENDGACAVVVTTAERAADSAHGPVALLGAAQGALAGFGHGQYSNVSMPDDDYASAGARQVAARLWAASGVGPSDIDVAQIYDHFTGLVLLSLEDFGFCGRGEGGPFAASGALSWSGGSLPTNTHGGSLSEAYIHGLNHVVEGVRQLRGSSTCQVDGARTCLVTSAAGVPTSALVLAPTMTERWFPDEMPMPAASAETVGWWEAAAEHRLVVQRCTACGHLRHPPGPVCPVCRSTAAEWSATAGTGTVYTYTVVRQAFIPSLADKIPYVVIAVDLDGAQGIRMVSNLVDVEPEEVTVGMAVEVAWEDMGPELAVPRFRPVAGGGSR